jgi:hypothetical protein
MNCTLDSFESWVQFHHFSGDPDRKAKCRSCRREPRGNNEAMILEFAIARITKCPAFCIRLVEDISASSSSEAITLVMFLVTPSPRANWASSAFDTARVAQMYFLPLREYTVGLQMSVPLFD